MLTDLSLIKKKYPSEIQIVFCCRNPMNNKQGLCGFHVLLEFSRTPLLCLTESRQVIFFKRAKLAMTCFSHPAFPKRGRQRPPNAPGQASLLITKKSHVSIWRGSLSASCHQTDSTCPEENRKAPTSQR